MQNKFYKFESSLNSIWIFEILQLARYSGKYTIPWGM